MKHIFICFFIAFIHSGYSQSGKYGALAVDRKNGFYYGWAIDHETQTAANERAIKECRQRGGNCSIVKEWGGGWCAAYRTIKGNVGTAYGWAVARTKEEADRIATAECEKKSGGVPCGNYVWGCNSREKPKKEEDEPEKKQAEKEDDFWNGNKTPAQNNPGSTPEFWKGKGTSQEEQQFENQTNPPEKNQFIGDIESYGTKYLNVRCRDHGMEDGDRVKVALNGSTIKSDIYLRNHWTTFEIQLKSGQNRIDFTALNEGSASPNTAQFIISDDKGKIISDKEWNIKQGYTATLLIVTY